jgi:hypothetical protein
MPRPAHLQKMSGFASTTRTRTAAYSRAEAEPSPAASDHTGEAWRERVNWCSVNGTARRLPPLPAGGQIMAKRFLKILLDMVAGLWFKRLT